MNISAKDAALRERRFFTGMGIMLFLVAFIGFSQTFYLDPILPDRPKPGEPFYYTVHGPVFTLWIALIAVQPWLIRRGNYQLHRQLGWFGLAVAIAVVVTGLWGALLLASGQANMVQTGLPPKQGWATPFTSMMTFSVLVAVGIWQRKDAATHKRAMILATIGMMGAPLARWPVIGDWPPSWMRFVLELMIVAVAIYDWRKLGRIHAVTLWGGLLLVVSHRLIKPAIWKSDGWMQFTDWIVRAAGLA